MDTPHPATPDAVVEVCKEVVNSLPESDLVGVGFPGVVSGGKVFTAQNLDKRWIGFPLEGKLKHELGLHVRTINDADAAGVAEVLKGAGHKIEGTVIVLTIGTGVGSAFFTNGSLVANTELGRMLLKRGLEVEAYGSDRIREKEGLSLEEWADRLQEILTEIERVFWPSMIIIGGGGAKDFSEVQDRFQTEATLCHAEHKNKAGIIGAALWAAKNGC